MKFYAPSLPCDAGPRSALLDKVVGWLRMGALCVAATECSLRWFTRG